jgi:hypothetical protein
MLLTNTHSDNVLLLVNSTAVELEFNSVFQFNSLQTKQFLSTHLRKKVGRITITKEPDTLAEAEPMVEAFSYQVHPKVTKP